MGPLPTHDILQMESTSSKYTLVCRDAVTNLIVVITYLELFINAFIYIYTGIYDEKSVLVITCGHMRITQGLYHATCYETSVFLSRG